jgi:TonB-linked SusC/RagA family outer membrane protein
MKYNILLFFGLVASLSFAQQREISGTVTSKSDGAPIPGASVIVVGTASGTVTDFDGNYALSATTGDVLQFSFVGMLDTSITVGSNAVINIQLEEDVSQLEEVVVTALGIERQRKSLTYAAQDVDSEELTRVKQTNPINSLSGKVSGVNITRSASGVGGATKVVLRGNSSTSLNDPLYVIDGVPMQNNGNGQNGSEPGTDIFGSTIGNRDGGDITSLINPDDIKSISILKGGSAAALYGSQGANGVILITTKSGRDGVLKVSYNSSITIDNVVSLPKLQTEYQSTSVGQPLAENGRVADPKTWGKKASGLSNTVDDFFKNGYTSTNSISLSSGTAKAQTYFSFANTMAGGVIPQNKLKRNVLTLRETANFFDNKVNVSANVSLSDQRIWNRPTNGLYSNPLTGLYLNPVGIDLNIYKNKFEYFNKTSNMFDQYSSSFDENIQQNPYWLIHRNPSKDIAQRILSNISVDYKLNDNISFKSRGSFDKSFFTFDKRIYAGSDPTFAPNTGRYILEKTENTQQYIDLIGVYTSAFSEDFDFNFTLGTSITKYKTGDKTYLDSGVVGGLKHPNEFTLAGFRQTNSIYQAVGNREVQSVFGALTLGYKDMLYLDLTARTDWDSSLSFTNNNPINYPSVGLTTVITEMFDMPESISFAKLRASYAKVGNALAIPAYGTNPRRRYNPTTGILEVPRIGPRPGAEYELKPEQQISYEIGTEWRFFENRLSLDFTYYNSSTEDQIFIIDAIESENKEGVDQFIVNAGEITNRGVELVLSGIPISTDNFRWKTAFNYASNKNKVVSVHPNLENGKAILTDPGVNGYGYSLIEGEDFGSITANSILRDANGIPIVDSGTLQTTGFKTVAHAQPDFSLGWNNTFTYKKITLNMLVDGKFGGDVVSVTEAVNDKFGVSQATANARNTNGGMIDVVDKSGNPSKITAQSYYNQIGGRDGLHGEYVYDATNIVLRELSIGYTLPTLNDFFESVNVSLIANNLFFIYKEAPFDPNITSSTGVGLQGVDIYGQPSTRSIGINLNVNF